MRVPWRVLNAGHFGTPQNRERLILLGAQRGDSPPEYPTPVTEIASPQNGARGAFTSPRPIHYLHDRCVTVREMARLHGFPDWFRFNVTKWHGGRQIGNSVPPPLARAIAGGVMRALGVTPMRPRKAIALGEPALLSLDLSGAAKHFGVKPPPSRRDRKSGARKRRQIDIERERLGRQVAHA